MRLVFSGWAISPALAYYFNSLILRIYFCVIFLVIGLDNKMSMVKYSRLFQVNTNLMSILYRSWPSVTLFFLFYAVLMQIKAWRVVCPSLQPCNYCFIQSSFKSDRRISVVYFSVMLFLSLVSSRTCLITNYLSFYFGMAQIFLHFKRMTLLYIEFLTHSFSFYSILWP